MPDGAVQTTVYDGIGQPSVLVDALGQRTTLVHNAFGLCSVQDPAGHLTTTLYDDKGRVSGSMDANGSVAHWGYDVADRRISESDALGRITTLSYDQARRRTAVEDPSGATSITVYDVADPLGSAVGRIDPAGHRTTILYDLKGRLIAEIASDGQRATTVFDALDRPYVVVAPSGARTTTAYDPEGRVRTVTAPTGGTTTSLYDALGSLGEVTDPVGRRFTTTYDALGAPLADHTSDGRVTQYEYDASRRQSAVTDYLGMRSTATFDPGGRLTGYENIYGNTQGVGYDPRDLPTLHVDEYGQRTTYGYEAGGRLARLEAGKNRVTALYDASYSPTLHLTALEQSEAYNYHPDGRYAGALNAASYRTTVLYDQGRVAARLAPDGVPTTLLYEGATGRHAGYQYVDGNRLTFLFDGAGRRTGYQDEAGYTTQAVLDESNRPIVLIDALSQRTSIAYDVAGRVAEVTTPRGAITTNAYDGRGRLSERVDGLGFRTTYQYDAYDRLLSVQDATGAERGFHYDGFGRRDATVSPLGYRTTTLYNALGKPEAQQDSRGFVTSVVYDAAGKVAAVVDPLGYRTTALYDALGREAGRFDALGYRTTAMYDVLGRVQAATDKMGYRTTYEYDAVGRLINWTDALGRRTTHTYTARGFLKAVQDARGYRTSYGYDGRGLPTFREDARGYRATTQYDGLRRPLTRIDPLGYPTHYGYNALGSLEATEDALGFRVTWQYDLNEQPTLETNARGYQTAYRRDAVGRVVGAEDALGYLTTMAYDAAGNLQAVQDARGAVTAYGYDPDNRRTASVDAFGQRTTVAYDPNGRPRTLTDPLGYTTTTRYDAVGRPVAATNRLGYVTTVGYDGNDRVVQTVDALGAVTTSVYDAAGQQTGQQDALGFLTTLAYDAVGNVRTRTDPLGHTTTWAYDPVSNVASQQNARGYVTTFLWDGRSARTNVIDALGYITTTAYDPLGRVEAVQNPLGETATFTYLPTGAVEFQTDALGYRTTFTTDPLERRIAAVDPLGHRTTLGYDAVGNPTRVTDALGATTQTEYDLLGRATVRTNARGFATTAAYDARGSVQAVQDALGNETAFVYDAEGQQIASHDALGRVRTVGYGPAGRSTYRVDPLGFRTTVTYDGRGQVTTVEDALGHTNQWEYDGAGQRTAQRDALNFITTWGYDEAGNQIATTDPLGHTTAYAFDARDALSAVVDPLSRTRTRAYNAAGRLHSETDANGAVTTHLYDARGLETGRQFAEAGLAVSMVYDAAGRRTAVRDATGWTTLTYDAVGRPASVLGPDYPAGVPFTYGFDAVGNRVSLSGSSAWGTVTAAYGARDLLIQMTDGGFAPLGIAPATTTFVYDALGRRAGQTSADGVVTAWEYDPSGRLLRIRHTGSDALERDHVAFGYDAAGRPAFRDAATARHTYGYDAMDRLTSEAVTYQRARLLQSVTLTYDARDDFQYDSSATSANGAWRYGWSATLTADFVLDSGPASSAATGGATGVFGYEALATTPYGLPVILANDGPDDPALFNSNSLPMSTLLLHPGDNSNYAVLRFVAPYPGLYSFVGAFRSLHASTTTDVHIQRASDTTDLFWASQTGTSGPNPFSLSGVTLGYGEAVDFRVGDGGNGYGSDSTGLTVQVTASPVWNAVDDFTLASNPNTGGAWSYGSTPSLGGAFSPFTGQAMDYLGTTGLAAYYTVGPQYDLPFLLANLTSPPTTLTYYGTIVHPPDVLDLHTGSGGVYSVLRFTAQVAGTYHIEGYFDGLESGGATATDVHVQKNGLQSLWTSSVAGYGPSSAEAFYLADVPLAEGDTVDFCVGEGTGGYLSDPTGLRVEIALTAGLAASDTPGIPAESAGRVTTWTYDAAGRRTGQGLTATGFGAEVPPGGGNGVTVPTFSIYDDSDALTGAVSVFPTGAYYTSYSYDANGSRTGQETGLAGSGVSRRTTYGWDAAGRLASVELPHAADNPSSQRHTFTYSGMGLRHEHIGPDGRDVLLWDMAAGGGSDPLLWRGTAGASSLVYERFIQEPDANAAFPHLVRAAGRNAQGVAFSLTYHTDAHGSAAYLAGLPGTGSGSATFTFDAWGERLSPVADTGAGGTPTVVPSALGGGATIDENPLLWLGGLGYWREPALAMGLPGMGGAANSGGLSYVRARWLDSLPAQWLSVDPVMGEPRYGYAGQMPTLRTDPSGTQSLGDLLKGGADWAAQQFGYRDAAAVGSDAASGVMAVGRAVGDWVQSGVSAARQAAAVVGQGVRLTLHVAAGVARTILIDPWTSVWEVVSHASMQLFARASQTWSHHVGVLRQIWNTLERLFQTTTAHWERVRRSLPPILANVLPPSPTNVREFADYQVGLLWGALQGLFGMVGAVAAIPAMVEFLQFLIGKIGQSDFWSVLWEMVKAQWDSFAGLFTHEMGMDARARGELLGSVLIGVILLVVEILTGLAATGVALEFTGAGILRALKATGKLGLEEARNAAAKLGERVSPVRVGRTHGFAHAVAGSEGLLRNRAPIDWQLTLGKLTREVGEHLHGQTIGVLKRDVETVQQLGGAFKARVRQHFNGERRSEEPLGFHESSGSGGGNGGGGGDDGGSGGGRGGDEPEDIIRRNIEGVYQKFGGRPANIEAINASLQEITDSAVVLHFHREKGISEILGGESRLKTGIEGGVLEDPNVIMRRRVEEALFGQPKKDAPGIFYGVLQDKSESYATSNAKKYGSIALTLREHIKGRSTITRRDSLKVLSANSYDPVKAMMPAVPLSKIEGAFLGDALRHNDEILSATSVKRLREIEDPLLTDLDAIINQNYIGDYFEVQIHGGLEARDIQHAEFNQGDVSNEVKEWLTRNNITFTEHTQ